MKSGTRVLDKFELSTWFTPEPVTLIGEGEYNQDALKDIEVTDSYLGMDQEIRGCQDSEPYYNCTTREYISRIKEKCGCLPINMRLSAEVIL